MCVTVIRHHLPFNTNFNTRARPRCVLIVIGKQGAGGSVRLFATQLSALSRGFLVLGRAAPSMESRGEFDLAT